MNHIHKLDKKAFRKKRLPWLILMMLPSLILDAVIIYRFIEQRLEGLNSNSATGIWEFLMLLMVNAVLFKSAGIIIYFIIKSYRGEGEVRVGPDKVVYRKKRFVGYTFYFNYRIYAEYRIENPEMVTRRGDGSIVIKGEMPVEYFEINGKDINGNGTKHRCVIPGYFEDMDSVFEKLGRMSAKKQA